MNRPRLCYLVTDVTRGASAEQGQKRYISAAWSSHEDHLTRDTHPDDRGLAHVASTGAGEG